MSCSKRAKNDEEDSDIAVLQNLDKTIILQDIRYFNSTPVNPKKCMDILTQLLFFLYQGEELTKHEATDTFFAITKLFQCKDMNLRRLVYLSIKELSSTAEDVIMVTSSLLKDMAWRDEACRAAAARVLCRVTDNPMLQTIERYYRQAIIYKSPSVSSAALVCALHISTTVPDLVRRWANEAQAAVSSENPMVAYHALGVMAKIRENDSIATIKLISKLLQPSLRTPYALCLLIRLAAKIVEEDEQDEAWKVHMQFIESCLRNKSEIVVYEAAHAIATLGKTVKDLAPAVAVLQMFCLSPNAAMRYAGARTLAKLSKRLPIVVVTYTADLENLLTDPNRLVATSALTALLFTGSESSVKRLIRPVASFISETPDEMKIIVVDAIQSLYSKNPHKSLYLTALASLLSDKGGKEYKTAIVIAIISCIEINPDAKEAALSYLCEYIDDCKHGPLCIKILHVLGQEGPKTPRPSRFIRYIYNRVLLDSGSVRAAAISAAAHFGAACPELRPNIKILLSRCHLDEDDEVRVRAILYSNILDSQDQELINKYILNIQVPDFFELEKSLREHLQISPDQPFDIATVSNLSDQSRSQVATETPVEAEAVQQPEVSLEELYEDQIKVIPGIENLGPTFKTCTPVNLTEPATEYRIRCVKHVFAHNLVLQFECMNRLKDQLLEKVSILLAPPKGYKLYNEVTCDQLEYDKQSSIFCILYFPETPIQTLGSFGATLEFIVRKYDKTTGLPEPGDGHTDTYAMEKVEVTCADQFRLRAASDDWEYSWEHFSGDEVRDTFGLSHEEAEDAAVAVCDFLGIPRTAIDGGRVKEIRGGGLWHAGVSVLIKARLVASQGSVIMQMSAKASRQDIALLILAAVG